jgi:hypothetical protein
MRLIDTTGGHMASVGRRTKLTEDTQTTITDLIRGGNTNEAACAAAGIAQSTFYNWMERGEADLEHDRQTRHSEFVEAVTRAIGESEAILVKFARNAAEKDGRVALDMLARRFPERWAARAELRGRVHHTSSTLDGLAVPSDETRMAEVALVLQEIGMFGQAGDEEE